MLTGLTNDNNVISGCSIGDLKGKIEYSNNIQHFLSGYTDYEFTDNVYEKYDVIYPVDDRVDELKYRDISASDYISDGYIFEYTKYSELIKHKSAHYINFFKDVCLVWKIKEIADENFIYKECAVNTQFGGYYNKHPKLITLLSYDDATVLYRGKNGLYRSLNNDEKNRCKEWLKKKSRA